MDSLHLGTASALLIQSESVWSQNGENPDADWVGLSAGTSPRPSGLLLFGCQGYGLLQSEGTSDYKAYLQTETFVPALQKNNTQIGNAVKLIIPWPIRGSEDSGRKEHQGTKWL